MSNNGGYNPIPGGNIWSPSVPQGTYGTVLPDWNIKTSNTTPQLTGPTFVKGNGYVQKIYNDGSGKMVIFTDDGGTRDF